MDADIKGSLMYINKFNKTYTCFEHRGKSMSKAEVKKVLEYGLSKGYKSISEIKAEEVDKILNW